MSDDIVAIVGAGPAGLMAAEYLAGRGERVAIFDAMPSPARKFLLAGRGGLNLTHGERLALFLTRYRPLPPLMEKAIRAFDPAALRTWADEKGAEIFVGSSGRVFPKALKASPLLRAWLRRLDQLGVVLKNNHRLADIAADGTLTFQNAAGRSIIVKPRATVLAMGGASWPRLGSTGTWRDILLRHGISVVSFQPSNMGLCVAWNSIFADRFAGTPLKNISLSHDATHVRGEMVITRDGIEGGAAYALSAEVRDAMTRGGGASVNIDLKPDLTLEKLVQKVASPRRARETMTHFLARVAGLSPAAIGLLRESTGNVLPQDAASLAQIIKAAPLKIAGVQGLERAISSAGGVSFGAVDAHYMLNALPGVFVAGEMLDWEAPTGGYLLQATFATAVAAAKGVCHYLSDTGN